MSSKPDVFLAPCDPENFDRTVGSPVDLSEFPDHPDPLSEMDEVRFWGARAGSGNRNHFEKMASGDLVLFYHDGRYVGVGWVGTTFEDDDEWASSTFWRDAPSHLIYTIEDFTPVSVSRAAVNSVFDYSDGYYPQGLMRVADKRVDNRAEAIKLAVEKRDRM